MSSSEAGQAVAVRWAVVGATGLMGRKAIAAGLMPAHNCEVVAVQGLYEDEVMPLAESLGLPGYTSVEDVLGEVDCDAVYVASPQHVHLEHVTLAAERGRHVLCEKPLARSGGEAEAVVDVCRWNGVKLGTGFNLRFNSVHAKAKELIAEGAIGQVVSARCQYGNDFPPSPSLFRQAAKLAGGGSMVDLGVHAMDLVEFVTGKRFGRVMAVAQNAVHHYEVEDCCGALFEFEDGGFAFVDSYYNVPMRVLRDDLEVNGTRGVIYTVGSLIGMETGGDLFVVTDVSRERHEFDGPDMYQAEFEAFSAAILEDRQPPCSGLDGLHSQYLLDAVYASARLGRKVEVNSVAETRKYGSTEGDTEPIAN